MLAALGTIPVGAALDRPLVAVAAALVCPSSHPALLVRASHDLTAGPHAIGSATTFCTTAATEDDCRWGRPACVAVPASTPLAYAVLLGCSYAIALAAASAILLVRSRAARTPPPEEPPEGRT